MNSNDNFMDRAIFPKTILNRPGLSRIDYRIGTFSDFREEILQNLYNDPTLSDWTYTGSDDPGIALLEGVSILSDILTFYQELYANEAYLRTAKNKENIAHLVSLLGYRLSAGLGGRAQFALEVKGDTTVVIPIGFPLKAQLQRLEQPVDFETEKEIIAYPTLSKFKLYLPLDSSQITSNTVEFYVSSQEDPSTPVTIEKGDRLLVGIFQKGSLHKQVRRSQVYSEDFFEQAQIVIVDDVKELPGRKVFKIKGILGPNLFAKTGKADQIAAFKLGRTFQHFGHNAPQKVISVSGGNAQENKISYIRYVSKRTKLVEKQTKFIDQNGVSGVRIIDPTPLDRYDFPFDVEVNDLSVGATLLIQGSFFRWNFYKDKHKLQRTFVRKITNVRSSSMTWGSISGSTTVVTIDNWLATQTRFIKKDFFNAVDIRDIQIHEVISPKLTLSASPNEKNGQGNTMYFFGNKDDANELKGRQILFSSPKIEPYVMNVQSVKDTPFPQLHEVTLSDDVNYDEFIKQNVTVYGNLADATQGKTQQNIVLGDGDSRQEFQTFKIPKSPLTYLNNPDESPPAVPELKVYVNDILWSRVNSFFGKGPKDQVYVVREDPNGNSWVQFGDGKTGSTLPTGKGIVTADFRIGIGATGPLKTGATVEPQGRLDSLDTVQLPSVASGGSQPESGEKAREAATGKIQSLGRLVSLEDFELEALAVPGVSKASSAWDIDENGIPSITLVVMMENGREKEFDAVTKFIENYDNDNGPQRYPVNIMPGKVRNISLNITYGLNPNFRKEAVKYAIQRALGASGDEKNGLDGLTGLFGRNERRFGQPEYISRIEGTIQNVEGVVWSKVIEVVDLLSGGRYTPNALKTIFIPWILGRHRSQLSDPIECSADQILSLSINNLQISDVQVPQTEVS